MTYCGGAQIFQSCQPTAVGEGQRGARVGFHGLAEGAAGAVVCLEGDVAWLIAGKVVEQGAVLFFF